MIIVLVQCLIKFLLINHFIEQPGLNNFNFFLFITSILLITAGGYIINDIYDEKSDKINKEDKRIINKKITAKIALVWYILFNIVSLILITYVCYIINKLSFSLIFLYSIFALWRYSKKLKNSFLKGNLIVSWLVALSIINLGLLDIIPVIRIENSSEIIFKIILIYALFSFLMTLSREIIKDAEDIEGDRLSNANTLIIKLGLQKTKLIINSVNFIVFFLIGIWQYFQYSLSQSIFNLPDDQKIQIWGTDINSIQYVVFLQLLIIFFIIKCSFATNKHDFSFLSKISKFIMITGIISIAFFTLSYIN
jgi:4-hydroxybenzoate polyprenyltransferase